MGFDATGQRFNKPDDKLLHVAPSMLNDTDAVKAAAPTMPNQIFEKPAARNVAVGHSLLKARCFCLRRGARRISPL